MKNRPPAIIALLCAVMVMYTYSLAQPTYNFYFGENHCHTWYSDGNQDQNPATYTFPVARSITWARDHRSSFDFLGISDHNHNESLNMTLAYWRSGFREADSVNQDGNFVGFYGQEWGTISTGGHVLVYGTNKLFGWNPGVYDVYVAKGDYNGLFTVVKANGGYCYLAHPDPSDFDGIFTGSYNANWDSVVEGVAIKSGNAFSTNTIETDPDAGDYVTQYHDLLRKGYHVAPIANQDNHNTTFGKSNQQRTGLLATSLTKANVDNAFRNRRVYATEDHNLQVQFEVGTHRMGEIFSMAGPIPIRVKAIDAGESISRVEIRYGVPGSGTAPATLQYVTNRDSLVFTQSQSIGTTYYYYAYVVEADGHRAWTAPMWITITTGATPGAFAHLSPSNGSTEQPISGTLRWQTSSNATGYDVYLGTNNPPTSKVSSNQADTFYNYSELNNYTTYYWKIVAKNATDSINATGAPWNFTTVGPPPGIFQLVSPLNNAVGQMLSGTLIWKTSTNAVNYDVYIDVINPPVIKVDSNRIDTAYSYSGLVIGAKYYWKVIAKNSNGTTMASDAPRNFTIATIPAPPSNITASQVTTNSLQLDWVDNANDETGYRVYQSLNTGGPFTQIGSDLPANTIQFTDNGLQTNQRYHYRVVPFNDLGEGNYAAIDRTTLAAVPNAPTIMNVHSRSVTVIVSPDSNPSLTQYAIKAVEDTIARFVQQNGTLGISAQWQTYSEWGGNNGIYVLWLTACKNYSFSVEARNLDGVETVFGDSTSQLLPCDILSLNMVDGWNLISVPVLVENSEKTILFPTSSSDAFEYSGSYNKVDSLFHGTGYWLKYNRADVIDVIGDSIYVDSIPLVEGWNMIGSITIPVEVSNIFTEPSGIVTSDYFLYSGVYNRSDLVLPGQGYWVKSNSAGVLILSSSTNLLKSNNDIFYERMEIENSFTFEDELGRKQTIYLTNDNKINLSSFELPPNPPVGSLDVRYNSQRYVEALNPSVPSQRFQVNIQSPSSVKFSWHIINMKGVVIKTSIGSSEVLLENSGSIILNKGIENLNLIIENTNPVVIPEEYILYQNFPNPFNPETIIQYELPEVSRVNLVIYNMLGEEVSELVDEIQKTGKYEINWQPNLPSGIYYYQLEITNLHDPTKQYSLSKQAILLK